MSLHTDFLCEKISVKRIFVDYDVEKMFVICVCLRCVIFFFFRISAQLSSFEVSGLPRGDSAPVLLSPRHVDGMKDKTLLNLMFETNPLDASADQRLRIESQALEIIYDAVSVRKHLSMLGIHKLFFLSAESIWHTIFS